MQLKCFAKEEMMRSSSLTLYVSLLSEKYKNGKMNLIKLFDWFGVQP
jgi:hypothetical protein